MGVYEIVPSDPDFLQSEAVITTKARVNVCRDAIFIILKRVAFLVGHRLFTTLGHCTTLHWWNSPPSTYVYSKIYLKTWVFELLDKWEPV